MKVLWDEEEARRLASVHAKSGYKAIAVPKGWIVEIVHPDLNSAKHEADEAAVRFERDEYVIAVEGGYLVVMVADALIELGVDVEKDALYVVKSKSTPKQAKTKIMKVGDLDDQGDRILLYERPNAPYHIIAPANAEVKVDDSVEYEPFGINFGWFVKVINN